MNGKLPTTSNKKKPSPVGCLLFLAVIIAAFVYLPVTVGFIVTFGLFGATLLISAIFREFKRIRDRKHTNTSTIASAREGFAEITGKMVNEPFITTWISGEQACIRNLTFSYMKSNRGSNSKSSPVTLFHTESERKKVLITDGSDNCWVLLHAANLQFRSKTKRYRLKSLIDDLEQRPIDGFPINELEDLKGFKLITVTEEWLDAGKSFNCYGIIRKVKYGERPVDLIEVYNHKNQHRYQKPQALKEEDWTEMEKDAAYSDYKIMTSNYIDMGRRDIDPLIMTWKGDERLKRDSYIQIALMTFALAFLLFICIFITKAEYPELLESVGKLINENLRFLMSK